jgi:hypothetical protein
LKRRGRSYRLWLDLQNLFSDMGNIDVWARRLFFWIMQRTHDSQYHEYSYSSSPTPSSVSITLTPNPATSHPSNLVKQTTHPPLSSSSQFYTAPTYHPKTLFTLCTFTIHKPLNPSSNHELLSYLPERNHTMGGRVILREKERTPRHHQENWGRIFRRHDFWPPLVFCVYRHSL